MKAKSTLFGEVEVNQDLNDLFANSAKKVSVESVQSDYDSEEMQVENEQSNVQEEGKESVVQEEESVGEKEKAKPMTRREQKQALISKNSRTLFVGNVATQVIEKQHTTAFKKLFQQYGPLESIRFRSIAFAAHMPRKEAFLQKKLHEKRDSLNAYVVFVEQVDAEKALELNGSLFMEKHLRVDRTETNAQKQKDFKRSVFLGNLNFDLTEEALWNVFGDLGIDYVRIIRDRKSNIGKGFGYIQFKEKDAVPLALKLNGTDVEGRPVRVTKASEKYADKSKEKVMEGTRAKRDSAIPIRVRTKGSKVGKKAAKPKAKPTKTKSKSTKPKAQKK